jgi:hypothetical protein
MRTWTATTTVGARPEAVLELLTDPDACAEWAPLPFEVDGLDAPRLRTGSRARVSGSLAGQRVGFDVEVHEAAPHRLALSAAGPVAFDVDYRVAEHVDGSEVSASISVRPGRGLMGRVLASATSALLSAGALDQAVGRIARLAVAA